MTENQKALYNSMLSNIQVASGELSSLFSAKKNILEELESLKNQVVIANERTRLASEKRAGAEASVKDPLLKLEKELKRIEEEKLGLKNDLEKHEVRKKEIKKEIETLEKMEKEGQLYLVKLEEKGSLVSKMLLSDINSKMDSVTKLGKQIEQEKEKLNNVSENLKSSKKELGILVGEYDIKKQELAKIEKLISERDAFADRMLPGIRVREEELNTKIRDAQILEGRLRQRLISLKR